MSRARPPSDDAPTSALTRWDAEGGGITHLDGGAAVPLPRLEDGTLIADRYRVVGLLGRGGFGEVYRVRDERSSELERALKLHRLGSQSAVVLDALKAEFALLAELQHPSLARVHDFGWAGDDVAFFTQDIVPGARLDAAALDLGSHPGALLVAQLCRALAYLHGRGILHRDVKPSNVLVDEGQGRLALLDFGISRAFGEAERGLLVGTHAYLSPEAICGDELDARSDLYSLGVSLYRVATGRLPFGGSAAEVLAGHLYHPPAPIRPDELASPVATLIMRLLAKRPGDRPASAGEVIEELGAAVGLDLAQDTAQTLASYVLSGRLVGHDALVEAIHQAVHARGDSATRAIVLLGAGGTGKSRVAREVTRRAQIDGVSCVEIGVVRVGAGADVLPSLARAIVTEEVARRLPEDARIELARGVPQLRRKGERLAVAVDPERARRRRVEALGDALRLRFESRPGLVCVEDLHWADAATIELLAQLVVAARAAGADCLFLFTARPCAAAVDLGSRVGARTLESTSLDREAAEELVASMFGDADFLSATHLGRALATGGRSGLWVQESLRLAVERGEIARRRGRWLVAADIPALALDEVLAARVAACSKPARAVALAAAVLAQPVGMRELVGTAGAELAGGAAPVAELVGAGVLESRADHRGRVTYELHDHFADAVLGSVRPRAVAAAHRRAARYFGGTATTDREDLARAARHHEAAGDRRGADARYRRAAELAEREGRPDLALSLLERATRLEPRRRGVSATLRLHDLSLRAGLAERARPYLAVLARARRRASPAERVEIDQRLAQDDARRGARLAARRRTARALESARALGLRAAEARLLHLRGGLEYAFGSMEAALEAYAAAARVARQAKSRSDEAEAALGESLVALQLGRIDAARVAAAAAAKASAGARDPALASDAARQLGNVDREAGRHRRALGHYRRAVALARRHGSPEAEGKALNNLGTVAQWLGALDEAVEAFERAIAIKERTEAGLSALTSHCNLGALLFALGDLEGSERALRRVVGASEAADHVVFVLGNSNLAELCVARGRIDDAVDHFRVALGGLRGRGFTVQQMHTTTGLVRALVMGDGPGGREEATALLAELEAGASEAEVPEAQRRLGCARAALDDLWGRHHEALLSARRASRSRDRETRFSDSLGTPLEARFLEAIMLARLGRRGAAERAAASARRYLESLATLVARGERRDRFLRFHPLHRAVMSARLDATPGWAWPRSI